MSRRPEPARALRLAVPLLLVLAGPLAAQSGSLPPPPLPPPQMEVGQSDPAYTRLREVHADLVVRQQNFNRQRSDHIAQCIGIPSSQKVRIDWCRANYDRLLADKNAYAARLKTFTALQAQYRGRTLYRRGDHAGAIASFNEALRLSDRADIFDGYIVDDIDLARAGQAEAQGHPEEAAAILCEIDARKRNRPSWLDQQITRQFNRIKAWAVRYKKRFEVRTPGFCGAIRG